jgi:branched-chain amino acid transport system substrate-binding protein
MIVHAVEQANGADVEKMISGLEGWTFDAPKGSVTVRAEDHALLQPMFRAKLVGSGTSWKPALVATVPAATTKPVSAGQ